MMNLDFRNMLVSSSLYLYKYTGAILEQMIFWPWVGPMNNQISPTQEVHVL